MYNRQKIIFQLVICTIYNTRRKYSVIKYHKRKKMCHTFETSVVNIIITRK